MGPINHETTARMPDSMQLILPALIFFAAGFTQGVSGFGAALVAIPLLTLFMDIKTAVPLTMLNGLVITAFLSLQLKRHVDRRKIIPLLIGCLPGVGVGAFVLKQANADLMKMLLGGMIIVYAFYGLLFRPRPRTLHPAWAYLAGFGTGTIGSAFSAGGPPTIVYTTLTGWPKDDIKATLSGFFFISGVFIASAHAVTGLTTMLVLRQFLVTAGFVMAGVYCGSLCYGRIAQESYIKIMLIGLILMGAMMIATGI